MIGACIARLVGVSNEGQRYETWLAETNAGLVLIFFTDQTAESSSIQLSIGIMDRKSSRHPFPVIAAMKVVETATVRRRLAGKSITEIVYP